MKYPDPIICLLILTAVVAAFIAVRSTTQPTTSAATQASQRPPSSADLTEAVRATSVKSLPDTNIAMTVQPATATKRVSVVLRITGLTSEASDVLIAVFDSADTFPKSELSYQTQVVSASAGELVHRLDVEAERQLAIAVYQDLDGNRELTKNIFGIPAEPYGFSNNARGITGPPSFSSASVIVSEAEQVLKIQVH